LESITLKDCFKGSWRDAGGAMLSRPLTFMVFFVLILLSCLLNAHFEIAATSARTIGAAHAALNQQLLRLISICANLLWTLMASAQVMRFSLLGVAKNQAMAIIDRNFLRYAGLLFAVLLSFPISALVLSISLIKFASGTVIRHGIMPLAMTCSVLLASGFLYIAVRLSLLLCNAAVGKRSSYALTWKATGGHFWRIFATHIVVYLPIVGIAILIASFDGFLKKTVAPGVFFLFNGVAYAVISMIMITTSAACSAWFYRRYVPNVA
jgi:hypothetical protein